MLWISALGNWQFSPLHIPPFHQTYSISCRLSSFTGIMNKNDPTCQLFSIHATSSMKPPKVLCTGALPYQPPSCHQFHRIWCQPLPLHQPLSQLVHLNAARIALFTTHSMTHASAKFVTDPMSAPMMLRLGVQPTTLPYRLMIMECFIVYLTTSRGNAMTIVAVQLITTTATLMPPKTGSSLG